MVRKHTAFSHSFRARSIYIKNACIRAPYGHFRACWYANTPLFRTLSARRATYSPKRTYPRTIWSFSHISAHHMAIFAHVGTQTHRFFALFPRVAHAAIKKKIACAHAMIWHDRIYHAVIASTIGARDHRIHARRAFFADFPSSRAIHCRSAIEKNARGNHAARAQHRMRNSFRRIIITARE